MTDITVSGLQYRLIAVAESGGWRAHATRADTGDRFGITYAGATQAEALARLTQWLEWQGEHTAALDALQCAEQAYHRTIAGSAFAGASEGPTAIELQKESLDQVEAARVRLDEVRARRPD